ncbi:hypothetical protein PRIEUP_LOCUS1346, partial [Pristimantis euphronides]
INDLFEQLEAAAGTVDPRWLQARWAQVLEAARPPTPEGGRAAPQEECAAPGPHIPGSPAGAAGTLRRSQRARAPSRRARDGPQSARGRRRSPSGAPPVLVRSIIVPLHGARVGRNPPARPRPAEERGEASPHPAPSPSLGRRAAGRSRAVGRPVMCRPGGRLAVGRRREQRALGSAAAGSPPVRVGVPEEKPVDGGAAAVDGRPGPSANRASPVTVATTGTGARQQRRQLKCREPARSPAARTRPWRVAVERLGGLRAPRSPDALLVWCGSWGIRMFIGVHNWRIGDGKVGSWA